MDEHTYIGSELELFSNATNWKRYWVDTIAEYIGENVLEIGAGAGVNTNILLNTCKTVVNWACIEPDKKLADSILTKIGRENIDKVEVKKCFLKDLDTNKLYNTILYIDVIEHIENDQEELELAKKYLKKDGHLIILVPSYNCLYSPFDKTIGHYRRYNKIMLKNAVGAGLTNKRLKYLDSAGVLASVLNKFFLNQKHPTLEQILFWDRVIVRVSKITDYLVFHSFGKSLLGIWKK